MLPTWFAEYSLDLVIVALIASCAVVIYGWLVLSRGRFTGMLRDVRRSRRPAGIMAMTTPLAVIALVALGSGSSASHLRLTALAVVTVLLVAGLASAAMYPFRGIWTNNYWRIPPPEQITDHHIRIFGKVYEVFGLAFIVACIGGLMGLVPKLAYVGAGFVPTIFALAEIVALVIAVVIALKAWKLFQSVQVRANPVHY